MHGFITLLDAMIYDKILNMVAYWRLLLLKNTVLNTGCFKYAMTFISQHPHYYLNRVVRKPAFCICENKDTAQLRGNREADQRLCFRYTDSTIPLLSKSEISSLWPSSVAVLPGLCQTWSETRKTSFLTTRLTLCKQIGKALVKWHRIT